MIQIKQADPPRPSKLRPGLDRRLDAICRKAMAKTFVDRYRSMVERIQDLDAFLQPPAAPAPPRPRPKPASKPPSPRRPVEGWQIAAAVGAVLASISTAQVSANSHQGVRVSSIR